MHVESKGVGTEIQGVQDTSHEIKNNEGKDDDTSAIADKDIPEKGVHHPQHKSTTERRKYNLRPVKTKEPIQSPRSG